MLLPSTCKLPLLCQNYCVEFVYHFLYIHVICCVDDFKGKAVHTFVMCAHFPDVRTLLSMLHCG